jgi:hypothetical protein
VDEGFANLAKAVRLDPRSTDALSAATALTYAYRRYAESESYADRWIAIDSTSNAAYNWKLNDQLDGRGDTAAAGRTMDAVFARGVHVGSALAGQLALLGPAYRARLEQMSLADIGARQTFDTLNYYLAKRTVYVRDQPALARAYADSLLHAVAGSKTLAGPLAWSKAALLAFGYAATGDRAQAMRELAQVHAEMAAAKGLVLNDSAQRYQDIAGTFGVLGDADSAAAYVTQLFRLPGGFSKFTVRLDPTFDPVRNSPAFQRLLQ